MQRVMIMNETGTLEGTNIVKEIREVLESERLLTARLVDSVLRTSQVASVATPEMQDMFGQWLALIGEQVLREIFDKENAGGGECDVRALAQSIGVSEATLFSLLVSMHRSGKIRVDTVRFSAGNGKNTEACGCLM